MIDVLLIALAAFGMVGGGLVLLMLDNARTHTEEWRQERLRAWIFSTPDPPCATIGHEYLLDPTRCFWCDATRHNINNSRVRLAERQRKAAVAAMDWRQTLRAKKQAEKLEREEFIRLHNASNAAVLSPGERVISDPYATQAEKQAPAAAYWERHVASRQDAAGWPPRPATPYTINRKTN